MKTAKETEIMIWTRIMKSQKSKLEIEIGKSMMSSVFWEMWNENHGEIDEKVWVNQKTKKSKTKLGFVIHT